MTAAPHREEPRLDLLVAGHTNIDRFLDVELLPAPDRTVPLRDERAVLGGPAATTARVAARAGVRTGLISRVGSDFPESFLAELRRDGVDLAGLERVPEVRSPVCYIVEDGRGHQFTLIHQGPMGSADGAVIPEALLGSARWLHLGTGDPDYLLELKEAARSRGVRVAVDPAQEIHYVWSATRFRRLLEDAELLFGNRSEIEQARKFLGLRRIEELVERTPMVVRTEGADGATAFTRTGRVHVPARKVAAKHQATGAGDAFRGGFYGAYFEGLPIKECLEAGTSTAADWIVAAARARSPRRG